MSLWPENILIVLVCLLLVLAPLLSFLVTRQLLHTNLLAIPTDRSAHKTPMPTAGGIGLAFGLLLPIGAFYLLMPESADTGRSWPQLLGLGALATFLGYVDDSRDLSPRLKFAILGITSVGMALVLGPVLHIPFDDFSLQLPWVIGVFGTALWVFVMINGTNFMDGADGVIPMSALVGSIGLALLSASVGVWEAAIPAALLAASILGFLPFNCPQARIFLGDSGSLLVGTWLAGCALVLLERGPDTVLWLMPLLFLPWLSDVLLTMAWRLGKKKNLLQAHKDHLYQIRIEAGQSHFAAALDMSLQMLVCLGVALLFRGSPTSAFLGFTAAASFAVLVHWYFRTKK